MRITVNVTEQHIAKGKRSDCQKCPIAQAVSELNLAKYVMVDGNNVEIGTSKPVYSSFKEGTSIYTPLPKKAQRFISKFDDDGRKGAVKPFSFTVNFDKKAAAKVGITL